MLYEDEFIAVQEIIERLAATSSKNEKIAILEEVRDLQQPGFIAAFHYAYDPMQTFGIKPDRKLLKSPSSSDDDSENPVDPHAIFAALRSRTLTGNEAKAEVEKLLLSCGEKARTLVFNILNRDLRCGVTATLFNKVFEDDKIEVFTVMLSEVFDPKRVKSWPVAVEPKLDGVRVLCFITPKDIRFLSRTGKEFTSFEHLKPQLRDLFEKIQKVKVKGLSSAFPKPVKTFIQESENGIVLDGEVVSGSFNKTSGDVRRKDQPASDARFFMFAAFAKDRFDANSIQDTYEQNRHVVSWLVGSTNFFPNGLRIIPMVIANSVEEVQALYDKFRSQGLEGAMVKNLSAPYTRTRCYDWMKIKAEETIDLPITGAELGDPGTKYENILGRLFCDFDGVEVSVGGGFTDEQRQTFWDAWLHDCNLKTRIQAGEDIDEEFQLIGKMIEIEYHQVTQDGSLRHSRFIRFRDDK
jgi:DNA ligase-1